MIDAGRETLHIGAVAAHAGVHIQTLRYYERRGLFDRPERSPSGYRQYRPETVLRVRAIKRAQSLGFRLAEIRDLIRLQETRGPAATVRARGDAKLREIDEKIRTLQRMRRALRTLVATCACGGDLSRCRVLDGLDDGPRRPAAHAVAGVPGAGPARTRRRSSHGSAA